MASPLLGITGGHGEGGFEAGEVVLGVPVGCLQAIEETFFVGERTVVKNLLDGHSSGGT